MASNLLAVFETPETFLRPIGSQISGLQFEGCRAQLPPAKPGVMGSFLAEPSKSKTTTKMLQHYATNITTPIRFELATAHACCVFNVLWMLVESTR